MNSKNIAQLRLLSQQIEKTNFQTPPEIVGWLGALQAQDYAMAKWAVGVRLPNSTDRAIEAALNRGEIIRTHLLRPTWHLVSAADIYWLLELTAPQIKVKLRSRLRELELAETLITKSNRVIEKALSTGQHLTRVELATELAKNKILTNENRAYHLLLQAELAGIVCSGETKGKKQTYALLADRVPKPPPLAREEALPRLARKYFLSRCPATFSDFVWWSGLAVRDAQQALALIKPDFRAETIDSQSYWFPNSISTPPPAPAAGQLLPAFDEFLLSYQDRNATLPVENRQAVSNQGSFRPVIVVGGQVVGSWQRTLKKDKVLVEAEFFQAPSQATFSQIAQATAQYGSFLKKETELNCKP